MLIVGTDRIRVQGSSGAPEGTQHAVDRDGRVLCRTTRARFSWPALSWDDHRGEDSACALCTQVRVAQEALSQVPAYPVGPETAAPSTALMPRQPDMALFEADLA